MIDLLINKRTRRPIVAKPAGSVWGSREIDGPNLCVVQMDDPPAELAARLTARRVEANPFAEYSIDPVTNRPLMVRQSTVKLKSSDTRPGTRVRAADMEVELARPS